MAIARLARGFVPAHLLGLVLVFVGRRVLAGAGGAAIALTALGVLIIATSAALRAALAARADGGAERSGVERTLAGLQLAGLCAVAIHLLAATDAGRSLLGVARMSVEARGRFDTLALIASVALLVISLPALALGEGALAPMRLAKSVEARRVRGAVVAGLTLGAAAVYTSLAVYAVGALDVKADFSYFRTARPGESTKKVAQSLTEPVKVQAFFPPMNDVGGEVDGYLAELAKAAPRLGYERLDRLLVPAIAKEAKVTQDGTIVLSRGAARESISVGVDPKYAAPKLKTLDADFQKALLKVLRSERTAYLTVGHGELNERAEGADGRTGKSLRKLLQSQNYDVKDLGLGQGLGSEIPSDATMVIVFGPSRAFLPEEISALERYVKKDGKLLLALDPEDKADLAPLAALVDLSLGGVVLANDKAPYHVRRRGNESDRSILVTNRFSSHASVSTLSRNARKAAVIVPGPGALDKAAGTKLHIDFVLRSLDDTFDDVNGNYAYDEGQEKRSIYNLGAAISSEPKAKDSTGMRAFVVADADVFSDAALTNEANAVFLLDAARWLGGEESFSGAIETTEDVRIEHTQQKDVVWFYAILFGGPGLVLAAGLLISRRARRPRPPAARANAEKS